MAMGGLLAVTVGVTWMWRAWAARAQSLRLRACVDIIRDEFLEMPDMALTDAQACRLWRCQGDAVCQALGLLRAERFLVCKDGRYSRPG